MGKKIGHGAEEIMRKPRADFVGGCVRDDCFAYTTRHWFAIREWPMLAAESSPIQ